VPAVLRRTAATLLTDLGVPARDAQVILGHSTVSVTLGIYSEVFDTEAASALRQVNRALGGPGTDTPTRSM
jgi:integrase